MLGKRPLLIFIGFSCVWLDVENKISLGVGRFLKEMLIAASGYVFVPGLSAE